MPMAKFIVNLNIQLILAIWISFLFVISNAADVDCCPNPKFQLKHEAYVATASDALAKSNRRNEEPECCTTDINTVVTVS